MDDEPRRRRRRRGSSSSSQERRWSMSSQTLEQIVAMLMRPVSHYGQSFDRDDSGLLEEYLTAAGLRALEAAEAGQAPPRPPNYAELGLIIQSVSNNYSRKVDHLCRLVNDFRQRLFDTHPSYTEPQSPEEGGAGSGRAGAAADSASSTVEFAPIALAQSGGGISTRRSSSPGGPPPTLPRVYADLEPRPTRDERMLRAYDGDIIGSLDDFRVAWRLHEGYLVEELDSGTSLAAGSEARGMSLLQLQQACARAAAPAPLAPPPSPPAPPPSPPAPTPPPATPTTPMPPPAALRRKRRSEVRIEDMVPGSFSFQIDESVRRRLSLQVEFEVDERWIRRVVRHRRDAILCARRDALPRPLDFPGWAEDEARDAWRERDAALRHAGEQGGHSTPHSPYSPHSPPPPDDEPADEMPVTSRQERAPLDLAELARDVRRALPPVPEVISWNALAVAAGGSQPPARVLLDILMKATRGEVEIQHGPVLTVGEFSIRVVSDALPADIPDEDWLAITGSLPPPVPPRRPLPTADS